MRGTGHRRLDGENAACSRPAGPDQSCVAVQAPCGKLNNATSRLRIASRTSFDCSSSRRAAPSSRCAEIRMRDRVGSDRDQFLRRRAPESLRVRRRFRRRPNARARSHEGRVPREPVGTKIGARNTTRAELGQRVFDHRDETIVERHGGVAIAGSSTAPRDRREPACRFAATASICRPNERLHPRWDGMVVEDHTACRLAPARAPHGLPLHGVADRHAGTDATALSVGPIMFVRRSSPCPGCVGRRRAGSLPCRVDPCARGRHGSSLGRRLGDGTA